MNISYYGWCLYMIYLVIEYQICHKMKLYDYFGRWGCDGENDYGLDFVELNIIYGWYKEDIKNVKTAKGELDDKPAGTELVLEHSDKSSYQNEYRQLLYHAIKKVGSQQIRFEKLVSRIDFPVSSPFYLDRFRAGIERDAFFDHETDFNYEYRDENKYGITVIYDPTETAEIMDIVGSDELESLMVPTYKHYYVVDFRRTHKLLPVFYLREEKYVHMNNRVRFELSSLDHSEIGVTINETAAMRRSLFFTYNEFKPFINEEEALKINVFGRNYLMYALYNDKNYNQYDLCMRSDPRLKADRSSATKIILESLKYANIDQRTTDGDNLLTLAIKSRNKKIADHLIKEYKHLVTTIDSNGRDINLLYVIHFGKPLDKTNKLKDKYGRGWWFYSESKYAKDAGTSIYDVDINNKTYDEYRDDILYSYQYHSLERCEIARPMYTETKVHKTPKFEAYKTPPK